MNYPVFIGYLFLVLWGNLCNQPPVPNPPYFLSPYYPYYCCCLPSFILLNFPLPSCCCLPFTSLLFLLTHFLPHCSVSSVFYFRSRSCSYLSSLSPVYLFIIISLLLPVTRIFSFPFFCFILLLLLLHVFSLSLCALSSYSTAFERLAVTRCQKLPSKTVVHLEHGSSSRGVHTYLQRLRYVSKEVVGTYFVLRQTRVERV